MDSRLLYRNREERIVRGRFAPSPSGRMHLGNVYAALLSWLSVKSRGGEWLLRIEDIDRQRSRIEYAQLIEDDLAWLGLDWDMGGLEGRGMAQPCLQSLRSERYQVALDFLRSNGLIYPCRCRRKDILAASAPHQSDGRVVYTGACRPSNEPPFAVSENWEGSERLYVPDREISFEDKVFGKVSYNLADECGDFVLRRADNSWAYQLAVVVDDAEMGISEVARGCDLLLSAAQQTYLFELLGVKAPDYSHFPLLADATGRRLSKRDASLAMDVIRSRFRAEEIVGGLAFTAGLTSEPVVCTPHELIPLFDWAKVVRREWIAVDNEKLMFKNRQNHHLTGDC